MAQWRVSFVPLLIEANDAEDAAIFALGEAHDGGIEVGHVEWWGTGRADS